MSAPAIEVRGLHKRFGPVSALHDLDLSIPPGESFAILGPNGAGKSTLLRILAGLVRASAGEVSIDGERLRGAAARKQVGFVGHATLLYPELSARENLLFAARLYGVREGAARADRLLEQEGLAGAADRRAGTFSRGMAQRLALARARVHEPSLLLLDEPFTGLDRRSELRLVERLQRLRHEACTLVMVTHEVRQAVDLADHVAVLEGGRLQDRVSGPEISATRLERVLLGEAADA